MDTHKFFVENMRFHLTEEDTLVFVGWFYDGTTKNHTLTAKFDGRNLPVIKLVNKGPQVRQKYIGSINQIDEEVVGIIQLPKDWKSGRKLTLISSYYNEKRTDAVFSVRKLRKIQNEIQYYIENCHRGENHVTVSGWCMGGGEIKLTLLDAKKQPLLVKTDHFYRKDLIGVYPECTKESKPGFQVQSEEIGTIQQTFYLELRGAKSCRTIRLKKWDEGTRLQYAAGKISDTLRYLARNGAAATICKIHGKLSKKGENTYQAWRKKYTLSPEQLNAQRKTKFEVETLFSIVVPLYRTNQKFLQEMIKSVQAQTYPHWELCLADGSGDGGALTGIVAEYQKEDKRIRYRLLKQNLGISGNTNAAVEMAGGDFIVLMDHDDLLAPDALYEFARTVERNPQADVIYSDEDKVDYSGSKYFEPHFKPDYSPDLLTSVNYICHLFAVKKDLIQLTGGFRSEYDGAQDYDFILRCTEAAGEVFHVPKILYHWRCHADSTAEKPESKLYAFEAGRRAVKAHFDRLSIPVEIENTQFYGMYHTIYRWGEEPLVSVVIPNKDHMDDLSKCLHSLYSKSDYRNFEVIVVENNSEQQETFTYYREIEAEYQNLHVVKYGGGFNFSKINNFGVKAANGTYILLLNNDTEIIAGSCIRELLGVCMREDVGAVGAKLLYEDDTIQHAGVVLGFGGTAGHAFIGKSRFDTGYFGRILCTQNYSAVTAACMMTKRSVYEAVGGMTEELAVAFNDIDYCLKVQRAGWRIVYNPYAELYHYESKSRGYEDSPAKVERFQEETALLLNRWRDVIEQGDPCYNRNLALDRSDFALRH